MSSSVALLDRKSHFDWNILQNDASIRYLICAINKRAEAKKSMFVTEVFCDLLERDEKFVHIYDLICCNFKYILWFLSLSLIFFPVFYYPSSVTSGNWCYWSWINPTTRMFGLTDDDYQNNIQVHTVIFHLIWKQMKKYFSSQIYTQAWPALHV